MIGAGVFNLPSDMSRSAGPGAVVIGWVITGIGMLMLAFVCQGLALRKPRLGAGSYSCAKAACRGSSSTSRARREAGARTFSAPEAVIAAAILALGSCAAWLLWTERISPF